MTGGDYAQGNVKVDHVASRVYLTVMSNDNMVVEAQTTRFLDNILSHAYADTTR